MGMRGCIAVILLACALSAPASQTFFGQVLTDWHHEWKYEPAETNLAAYPWMHPEYDDGHWHHGQGIFAFPFDERLPEGQTNRTFLPHHSERVTHYFRTLFYWERPEAVYLTFSNLIDDGAVFYLNGMGIKRIRMPEGPVNGGTRATNAHEVTFGYDVFIVENPPLIPGVNVLAVEVHQRTPSGDVVFGCYARADAVRPACGWNPVPQHRDLVLLACSSATLTVPADGFPPPTLEWRKDGLPIAGATNASLHLTQIGFEAEGFYECVELTTFRECVLGSFSVTVIVDDGYLFLDHAVGLLDPTQIRVRFSYSVDETSAEDIFNYEVAGLTVHAAERGTNDRNEVLLTTDPRIPGQFYELTVGGVTALISSGCGEPKLVELPPTTRRIDLETVVLPFNAEWRYNDAGADLVFAWRNPQYSDIAWPLGAALLGFEDTQATMAALQAQGLSLLTPLSQNSATMTYYFRALVDLRFIPRELFTLRHVVDDGAVFYVNGAEVGRFNMPEGPIVHSTVAPTSPPEGVIRSLPISGLIRGTNVIAVEVHQADGVPHDMLFGAQLIGVASGEEPAELRITRDLQNGAITLNWFGRAILEQTATFPAQWTTSPDQSNPQTIPVTEAARFYRLRQ